MPMHLEGSCRCGAISFSVDSHTPYPYQRCYCSICRKSAGGGGYAINIMGVAETLEVKGKRALGLWNAPIDGRKGSANRHYCKRCGTPLWVSDEQWQQPEREILDGCQSLGYRSRACNGGPRFRHRRILLEEGSLYPLRIGPAVP
jgi:hypothetical protein